MSPIIAALIEGVARIRERDMRLLALLNRPGQSRSAEELRELDDLYRWRIDMLQSTGREPSEVAVEADGVVKAYQQTSSPFFQMTIHAVAPSWTESLTPGKDE